jgi:hypothetical protein
MNSLIRASTDIAGVKPLGPLLISCLAGDSLIARGPESRSGRMYRRVTWAVGVPLSYAYSIDLGLVLLAALLCQVTLVLIWPRKIRAGLRGRAFDSLVAMALGVFVAFGAWSIDARGRWGLVSGWTMAMGFGESMAWGFPGAPPWPLILLGSALCCGLGAVTAVNLGIAHKCESTSALHQPWGVLLGACAFAGPWVRYGWTLSDGAHLLRAVIPAIFILCCLVPAAFAAKSRPIWALVSLVGWLAVGPLSPSWVSIPASIQARAESIRAIDLTPAHILIDRDDLTEGSLLLSDSPAAAAFVWPQGVLVATLAGKRNACPTVQTYAALGDSLTDTLVDQLAANPTTPVLVNPRDSTLVGIEHTGRNSRVLENLLANYEIDQAAGDLFLRLRRRERPADWTRGPIEFSPDGTAWQPRQWPAADSRLEIPLDPGHDLRASDLLAVKLRLIDAPRGLLDKPGRVVVRFELDRSGLRHQSFFVPRDGQVHDYLISACTIRDPLWLTLFHPTRVWRSKDRLTSLTFGWEGLDAWSPPPAEVEIKSLEVLRRDGLEIREGPIADQGNPELRDWFFGNFSRTDQP